MTQADKNLMLLNNFILHITHSSHPSDGIDEDYKTPITFTPELLYQMAEDYIQEDHVDGRDNPENNIQL